MRTQPNPELTVSETISTSRQPDAVIGFHGRNTILGRDVLIFKRDALPTDGPFTGLPVSDLELEEDTRDVFILDGERVIGIGPETFTDVAAVHRFTDWFGDSIRCQAVHTDDGVVWDRQHVEVSL